MQHPPLGCFPGLRQAGFHAVSAEPCPAQVRLGHAVPLMSGFSCFVAPPLLGTRAPVTAMASGGRGAWVLDVCLAPVARLVGTTSATTEIREVGRFRGASAPCPRSRVPGDEDRVSTLLCQHVTANAHRTGQEHGGRGRSSRSVSGALRVLACGAAACPRPVPQRIVTHDMCQPPRSRARTAPLRNGLRRRKRRAARWRFRSISRRSSR